MMRQLSDAGLSTERQQPDSGLPTEGRSPDGCRPTAWHALTSDLPRPSVLNDPLDYVPDPLCRLAAQQVKDYLATRSDWQAEVDNGKMFGILVCEDGQGHLGFVAAYSGQLQGRADHPWFVPAVFDYLSPDGYFKREEAGISAINGRIALLESADDYVSARALLTRLQKEADHEITAYRTLMKVAKQRRDSIRAQGDGTSPSDGDGQASDEAQRLIRESQHQRAEMHRLKARWRERLDEASATVRRHSDDIMALKHERKQRSDALQRWLFDRFAMLNAQGQRRTLTDIFAATPQQVPPAGAGECCAPRLLQYAFQHRLKPLCIGEFWQGRSPHMEIRRHDHYYPACRGKCKPILDWMLSATPLYSYRHIGGRDESTGCSGTISDNRSLDRYSGNDGYNSFGSYSGISGYNSFGSYSGNDGYSAPLPIIYSDAHLLVVNKPAGLLSVPGKGDAPSVASLLAALYPEVHMAHRLDMDTSGLMVVALSAEVYHHLQRQFLNRTVHKRYVALVDGTVTGQGTITLPLRPDPLDRPRQLVDPVHGRPAVTDYQVIAHDGTAGQATPRTAADTAAQPTPRTTAGTAGQATPRTATTRLLLTPRTGRTHQLRVHCAHPDGLGTPIVGDALYGRRSHRLYLHAETLAFVHPVSGQRLSFTAPAPF